LPTAAEKRRSFRALHERGCFVIPNPWDVGSALYLEQLGFQALATTSSGAAWSVGLADGAMPLEPMLDHIRTLVEATDLPVNADFLDGFATDPEASPPMSRAASRPGSPGCRSRIRRRRRRRWNSSSPSIASARRGRRSMPPVATRCWLRARKSSSRSIRDR
jgi:hypothetical protein